jgi:hypothetical protein
MKTSISYMKGLAIVLIVLGAFLEVVNIFSLLNVDFDNYESTAELIGAYLFNVMLGVMGIILIIAGIRIEKGK